MPPPIPARYRLEVRLGRDQDLEEWLAADENLDRPVLIRILGPDAGDKRRREFLDAVRAAAAVAHPHLEPIFEVEEVEAGAFAVSEWSGGLTLQSRMDAGETFDYPEFLPNAAGLAGALAALHGSGLVHGAIDPGSILYTVSRPARLGGFGRPRRYLRTAVGDVSDLASVLEQALTGFPPDSPPPSEVVDGVPPEVDRALARARAGELDASGLAHALEAIPRPAPPPEEPVRSWRVPLLAMLLIVAAAGLIALGRVLAGDTGVPVIPGPSATAPATTTTTALVTASDPGPTPTVTITGAATFDPFGEGGENDERVGNVIDNDPATQWRTERYRDPVELLKPGVGVTLTVAGVPRAAEVVGVSAGASFILAWSPDRPPDPALWETIASGHTEGGPIFVQLPARENGYWLLWFSVLPLQDDGDYWTNIAEIRFNQ